MMIDPFQPSLAASILVLIFGIRLLLNRYCTPVHYPREPPVVKHRIPYIGHILGLFWKGTVYYEGVSSKAKLPIYTLDVLNAKICVVTAPDLVAAISRNSKNLTFSPFIAEVGCRLTGADADARAVIEDNVNLERGNWGYVVEVHDLIVSSMSPGPKLDAMNKAMIEQIAEHFRLMEAESPEHEVDLYSWLRHVVTLRSTTAIYGPKNPLLVDPSLEDAFWEYDKATNKLLLDIAPRIIAPRGHRARAKLAAAFQAYHETYAPAGVSSYIRARADTNAKYALSPANAGRLEVGTLIGILVNTVPAAFYLLLRIQRDAALLRDVRAELQAATSTSTVAEAGDGGGKRKRATLRVPALRDACPLLNSAWQETLRVHGRGASARLVVEDTLLAGRWLLKKGSMAMIPQGVMHADVTAWGDDTGFQARRFLRQKDATRRVQAASYRPFGGGSTICPGRFFVTMEVLMLTAMVLLRYDVEPVGGEWKLPRPVQTSLTQNVFPPEGDIRVKLSVREDLHGTDWQFSF